MKPQVATIDKLDFAQSTHRQMSKWTNEKYRTGVKNIQEAAFSALDVECQPKDKQKYTGICWEMKSVFTKKVELIKDDQSVNIALLNDEIPM